MTAPHQATRAPLTEWRTIGAAANAVVEKVARECFLARAAARERLYQNGWMTLDEAIEPLLDELERLRPCQCAREILDRWERRP